MANLKNPPGTEGVFYPLDNSAVFMASISGRSSPYLFRVSCELDDRIYLPALEEALSLVMPRFPSLSTELRAGVFWYYLEPLAKPVRLQADTLYPVEYHSLNRRDRHLFRVRAYGSRISCEFHHILTDGSGALEFLRSLVATYLTRRGVLCDDWEGVKNPVSPIVPGELTDSYAELSPGNIPLPDALPAAFHLPGRRYGTHAYRVISGTLSLSAALRVSREKGVSLTELLSAVYLAALQDVHEAENPSRWLPLCVQIPVNMRRFHPSVSLRNFFLFISVSIDRRLGHFAFQEILDRVHCLFKLNLTEKELNRQIRRNVGSERNLVSRLFPLCAKNPVLKIVSRIAAERPFSGNLSNLQSVSMPSPFAAHIRRFDILPSRRSGIGATIGVVSWQDVLSVTVGSLAVSRALERRFFVRCVELGIPVRVESNM